MLTPVPVVAEEEVDQLVRSARAGVAMLSLRLRSAVNEVAVAERGDPPVDLVYARELARSSLEQHIVGRRRELAEELEQARAHAALTVTAARNDAAELVASATEETRQMLLAGLRPLPAAPPSLRVVSEGPASSIAPSHPPVGERPAPAESARGAGLGEGAIEALAELEPDDELAHDPDRRRDVSAATVDESSTSPVADGATPIEAAVPATQTIPVVLDLPVPPALASAGPLLERGTAGGATTEVASRRARSGYLYLDVALPMIAVLVVLVVLLAWIG